MPVKTLSQKRKAKNESISSSGEEESTSSSCSSASSSASDPCLPQKSQARYNEVYESFIEHIREEGYPRKGRGNRPPRQPSEKEYRSYFDHLRKNLNFKPTTLWSYMSMLGAKHKALYAVTLKEKYPRLGIMLKNLSKNHKSKKAKAFSMEQLLEYMKKPSSTIEETQQRCLTALCFFGGLRCAELRTINIEDIKPASASGQTGFLVKYTGVKRTAEDADRNFLVPDMPENGNVFALAVRSHLENLRANDILKGPLARRPNKTVNAFTVVPKGKNSFYDLPKHIARVIKVPERDYTGHSLRRSAARHAADSGCSTLDLKRHFGWRSDSMAQVYIDQSESRAKTMASFLAPPTQSSSSASTALPNTSVTTSSNVSKLTIELNINVNPGQAPNINVSQAEAPKKD